MRTVSEPSLVATISTTGNQDGDTQYAEADGTTGYDGERDTCHAQPRLNKYRAGLRRLKKTCVDPSSMAYKVLGGGG